MKKLMKVAVVAAAVFCLMPMASTFAGPHGGMGMREGGMQRDGMYGREGYRQDGVDRNWDGRWGRGYNDAENYGRYWGEGDYYLNYPEYNYGEDVIEDSSDDYRYIDGVYWFNDGETWYYYNNGKWVRDSQGVHKNFTY